jgi:nitrous oxide reductase accessory protein NosL
MMNEFLRRFLLTLAALVWLPLALAASPVIPNPGAMDLCPVCGMLVSKYPNWVAIVIYKDGHAHFFDGAKDFFKFIATPQKYDAKHQRDSIEAMWVTEFYGLSRIDARKAVYVIGSDVLGPMGHELVPLENEADARDFLKEHQGRRILRFDEVTPEMVVGLDKGTIK